MLHALRESVAIIRQTAFAYDKKIILQLWRLLRNVPLKADFRIIALSVMRQERVNELVALICCVRFADELSSMRGTLPFEREVVIKDKKSRRRIRFCQQCLLSLFPLLEAQKHDLGRRSNHLLKI